MNAQKIISDFCKATFFLRTFMLSISMEEAFDVLTPDFLREQIKQGTHIAEDSIIDLFDRLKEILVREPNVLYLQSPITVCGDIHGQILDLFKLFEISGELPETKYLFLGDFVDRGYCSIETFAYLALLKIRFPKSIHLLRGNHESRQTNQTYGLYTDCLQLYGHVGIWFLANEVFDLLPIMAVINKTIYCVHGGLSPTMKSVGRFTSEIMRKQEIPKTGPMSDIVWSDPDEVELFTANRRGAGYLFGARAVQEFLNINRMKMVVRSHQLAMDGYMWMFDRSLVTVWSAPNYMYRSKNKASVMKIGDGEPEFVVFTEDERSSIPPEDSVIAYFA